MDGLGTFITLTGCLIFLIGCTWLVIQGYRKHWLWLIFAPLTIIIIPFINGRSSIRPVILIFSSVILVMWGATIMQGNVDSSAIWIILILILGYLWKKYPNSQETYYAKIVDKYGNLPVNHRTIAKLLKNDSLSNDVKIFNTKYFADVIQGQTFESINRLNENLQLFVGMMQKKYQISEPQILSCLIFLYEDSLYIEFMNSLDITAIQDERTLLKEVALKNIIAEQKPDYEFIQRFANQQKIKIRNKNLKELYADVQKEIKLSQFEKSFASDLMPLSTNIEQQIKQEKQLELINQTIDDVLDVDPQNYIIVGADYSRGSRIDNYYKKYFAQALSKAFNGHCCKCDQGMGQLEFDHFWWAKSRGGNFLMRSRKGIYINNCIPLCRSCNASKGNKDFREFFEFHEIEPITIISQSITEYINKNMSKFDDPDFPNRVF